MCVPHQGLPLADGVSIKVFPMPWSFSPQAPNTVLHGDNLPLLTTLPADTFPLIYVDPPFNTGRVQRRESLRTIPTSPHSEAPGRRLGFQGKTYATIRGAVTSYDDTFEDYWEFLEPRLVEAWRVLAPHGTLYLHLDYREVHYAKVLLDALFGRDCFLNEIVWAYDYGGRTKKKWPAKHDTILVYVKDPGNYVFNSEDVDREPYMAPGLVTAEKAARGKLPTDVWWHTIVSPTGKEKTGYPTQKPLGILRRIIQASSNEGDWLLDFFAGSGTTGAAASKLGRKFLLIDSSDAAISTMRARLPASVAFHTPDPEEMQSTLNLNMRSGVQ